jgi:Cof subfamily protein (haloacid dehalogenase superfamily)
VTAAADRIQLVVSDIDGTLVTSDKRLTAGVIRAAGLLAEAGVALSLVSSRPPAGFAMMREPLKISSAFGAFNGGALLKPDLSIIEEILVPAEAARIALTTFAELGVDAWLFTNDVWYVADPDGAYVPKERHTIQAEPVVTESFDPYLDKVGKLVGSSKDPALLAHCETVLQERLGNRASARRSQAYYLDVTPQIATKGYAVKRIASFLDVPLTQVAVIGDAANDMPMFAVAGMTIAMGNGIDELKARAHFTTESNEYDGFAVAMERYVLPRAKRV